MNFHHSQGASELCTGMALAACGGLGTPLILPPGAEAAQPRASHG